MPDQPMSQCVFETDDLLVRLDVTLLADINSMMPVVEGIMHTVREMKCVAGKEHEIELALSEALANAIVHGCKNDASKRVQCCVACDKARGMLIVVRDPGEGFDPALIPSPVVGQNIFSEHGRGIFLINQLMDEVRYERGGTEIHMHKRPSPGREK
ncbi:MAG TPA: ATP-binding protein [Terriglobia bacterium]|nr:ATP-binding protein [Terriglobia bacterium]